MEGDFDPNCFFDRFPRFVDTSATGHTPHRLNARYIALIHSNRELIKDARVLDLASHDGRFSFAALQSGASRVVGIEQDPHLARVAHENMELYDVPRSKYDFVVGNIFDHLEIRQQVDVVFCFGILYHIHDHMQLFSTIAEAQPRYLFIDSNVSQREGAVIELRNPVVGSPPPPGSQLESYPSKPALDAMLSSFGWTFDYFDWQGSRLSEAPDMPDYRTGKRVSVVVTCNDPLGPQLRERAVHLVFERQRDRRTQWLHVKNVASELGISSQALGVWVRKAERESSRESFASARERGPMATPTAASRPGTWKLPVQRAMRIFGRHVG